MVGNLANDLQKEFPGISGFSVSNLWRMRLFYAAYADNEKLAPMVREISWTKNILIFEQCKDYLEREFYIRMTRKFGWTKNVLAIKIEANTYENTLLNQTNFDQTVPEEIRNQAKRAINPTTTVTGDAEFYILSCRTRSGIQLFTYDPGVKIAIFRIALTGFRLSPE